MKNKNVRAKWMELIVIRFKDPINTTKVRKRMDPPNSLVIRITILP
jgi:hypothetical protein